MNPRARVACAGAVLLLALAGCQAAGSGERPASPAGPSATQATLYKYAGSRQCAPGGLSPEDAGRTLVAAGIEVADASCGTDGRMHASVCGGADGRIVIVKVPAAKVAAARTLGFAPIEQLPQAARVRCP